MAANKKKTIINKNKKNSIIKKPTKIIKKPRIIKTNPEEKKIIIETQQPSRSVRKITKNIFLTLLPLAFLIFLSWLMFYKIVPQIGANINHFVSGAKEKIQNNVHKFKDNIYNKFKDWNCPEWLATTASIGIPLLMGIIITVCCLAIPVIGLPLAAITGIITIVYAGISLFTTGNLPPNQSEPPREDVMVINHNDDEQKAKGGKTKDPTKK